MLLDWFFLYAAGVAEALAGRAEIVMVTRDHGHELGVDTEPTTVKRSLLDHRVRLLTVRGRQRDLVGPCDIAHIHRLFRRYPPDVLHAQDHADWRLFGLQRMLRDVPAILTIHDVVLHEGERHAGVSPALRRLQVEHIRSRADAYIVHGRRLAEIVQAQRWYRGQDINVIPHGRLPHAASASPLPSRPTILLFGRLEYYKGLDVLVEAAESAARSVPDLRVIVAGRGSDAARCRALVRTPELFEWRLGFVPNEATAALFGEASVVVLPYRDASQSGVAPTAFANGRPVIATDVGALSEAIGDGTNGLLVRDVTPEAVAQAIVRVFTEPGLLERLSSGASETLTAGAMSPESIAGLHMEAYGRLIRRAGRG